MEVYVHEAKMSGATIHNPYVNLSEFQTTVYGTDVYLGLMHIEKLEATIKQFIPEERKNNGDYRSLEDFVKRVNIGIETLQILIFVGAFRFTGKQKHELLIEARFLFSKGQYKTKIISLFDEPQKDYQLPVIHRDKFEDAFADPRYSMDKEKSQEVERSLREDVSLTFREPYPQQHEIGLPRIKMN